MLRLTLSPRTRLLWMGSVRIRPVFGAIKPDNSGDLRVYSDNIGTNFVYELRSEEFPGTHIHSISGVLSLDSQSQSPQSPPRYANPCPDHLKIVLTTCYSSHAEHTLCVPVPVVS